MCLGGNLFHGKDSLVGIFAITRINTVQKDQFLRFLKIPEIHTFFWYIRTINFQKGREGKGFEKAGMSIFPNIVEVRVTALIYCSSKIVNVSQALALRIWTYVVSLTKTFQACNKGIKKVELFILS